MARRFRIPEELNAKRRSLEGKIGRRIDAMVRLNCERDNYAQQLRKVEREIAELREKHDAEA